jgi:hypothetical protein
MAKLIPDNFESSKCSFIRSSLSFDINYLDKAFATMPKRFKFKLNQIEVKPEYHPAWAAIEIIEGVLPQRIPIFVKAKPQNKPTWSYGILRPNLHVSLASANKQKAQMVDFGVRRQLCQETIFY